MADSVKIEMQGAAELEARLRALPDRVAVNVMAGAMYAGAKIILGLARKLAPIMDLSKWNGPHEPANLLRNIFAARTRSHDRNSVGAKVGIGKEAFYGRFVEFGTRHAKAYPFMRPAADSGKEGAVAAVVDYAGRRIEQEAAKKA